MHISNIVVLFARMSNSMFGCELENDIRYLLEKGTDHIRSHHSTGGCSKIHLRSRCRVCALSAEEAADASSFFCGVAGSLFVFDLEIL